MKISKRDTNNEMVKAAISVLSETFCPAPSLDDAARKHTTELITQAIFEVTGVRPSAEIAYEVLLHSEFSYMVDETASLMRYV